MPQDKCDYIVHSSVQERDIPSLHGRELLKNSRMTALYERAKGGGHGQNMTTQKEEEGRGGNALLLNSSFS